MMDGRRAVAAIGIVMTVLTLSGCGEDAASTAGTSAAPSTTSAPPSECSTAPMTGVGTIDITEGTQSYPTEVYRPEGFGLERLPLVIDLHGLDMDGPRQAEMTGFRRLADTERFVVAEPSGPVGPLGVTGWEIVATDEPDRDDIGAIARLIDRLVEERCVDRDRVLVSGFSNGGFLAAELGCSTRVPVAAVAAVSGFHQPVPCERHVPTLVMHGTADPAVPLGPDGTSLVVDDTTPPAVTELLSASIVGEVEAGALDAGCEPGSAPDDIAPTITMTTYEGCDGEATHELILIDGGGHTWPGSAPTPDADLMGSTTTELDATLTIWDFFARS